MVEVSNQTTPDERSYLIKFTPMGAREIQTYSAWERELMKIASDDEEFYDMANFSG